MRRFSRTIRIAVIGLFGAAALSTLSRAADLPKAPDYATGPCVAADAYVVPKYTATEGEGYFSLLEGKNRRLYIGTHANAVNSWLVEFDPAKGKDGMKIVVDVHKEIGKDLQGFGSQAKIHTRNNVGESGKIYFGSKQGYPSEKEKREDYPGGYPMVYDPATGKTRVYPIPVPHEGINSIVADEARGVAYVSTCSDGRPGPGENSHFLVLDLEKGTYKNLGDTRHPYGFLTVDYKHRVHHPSLNGEIWRYDRDADKLEKLKQAIDGAPPTPEMQLTRPGGDVPINWDISRNGKTLYSQPMTANKLFAYDLTKSGDTMIGRTVGTLVPGAKEVDCRAMCVGPTGQVWLSVTAVQPDGSNQHHLVTYKPGEKAPRDLGIISIRNPDYTEFKDTTGKDLPFHGGLMKLPNGVTTTRYVTLGIAQSRDGFVNIMMLHPLTILRVPPSSWRNPQPKKAAVTK